jgi:hypothetical protein
MSWLLRNIALAAALTIVRFLLRKVLDRHTERPRTRRA